MAQTQILNFFVRKEDGMYIAEAVQASIVTDAPTFEELQRNIIEAVQLFCDDTNATSKSVIPSIVVNYEMPHTAYA